MENNQNQNLQQVSQESLPLKKNSQATAKFSDLLAACFALQKMYGRAPESMESVTLLFHSILGNYPAKRVIRAFETWLERSQEFPTPADIIGLIKRNGKPTPTREMYISASKKEYCDRTENERQIMRDYEAEYHNSEWGDDRAEPAKQAAFMEENAALRQQARDLKAENRRLSQVNHELRTKAPALPISTLTRFDATLQWMRENNAPPEDIEAFIALNPTGEGFHDEKT